MNKLMIFATSALILVPLATPVMAGAQSKHRLTHQINKRQKSEGDWQKLADAGGVLGALGQLGTNKTLSYLGVAGGLYSVYRMNEDKKSKDKLSQQRAELYGHDSYTDHGKTYHRTTVSRHGHKYYKFVPGK